MESKSVRGKSACILPCIFLRIYRAPARERDEAKRNRAAHGFVVLIYAASARDLITSQKFSLESIDKNIRGGGKITFGYIYVKIF